MVSVQQIEVVNTEKDDLVQQIEVVNNNPGVHGIMMQLPLPETLQHDKEEILNAIKKEKDVDGLRSDPGFLPATVKGVMYVLDEAQERGFISKEWDKVQTTIVGSEGMVGKELSKEMEKLGARVLRYDISLPASQGWSLRSYCLGADLLISATGVPALITKDMVKPGAVVIDVGAPLGDVEKEVEEVASFITPVPGGIGPMTVICLMENVIEAAGKQ